MTSRQSESSNTKNYHQINLVHDVKTLQRSGDIKVCVSLRLAHRYNNKHVAKVWTAGRKQEINSRRCCSIMTSADSPLCSRWTGVIIPAASAGLCLFSVNVSEPFFCGDDYVAIIKGVSTPCLTNCGSGNQAVQKASTSTAEK